MLAILLYLIYDTYNHFIANVLQFLADCEVPTLSAIFDSPIIEIFTSKFDLFNIWLVLFHPDDWHEDVIKEDGES